MAAWIQNLPSGLKEQVEKIVAEDKSNLTVLDNLYKYLSTEESQEKKRKTSSTPEIPIKVENNDNGTGKTIKQEEIIFELPQVSFQSPLRKRLNLVLHLTEQNGQAVPVLSVVNPSNLVPEMSLFDLKNCVKLCIILPILGNSTNPQKKGVVSLCFWINDKYVSDPSKNDPIICQLNLDQIKKQMIKSQKLPANAENQLGQDSKDNLNLNPIQERIIDYFQRQFKLCGIDLINYLPCSTIFKNKYTLNTDNGLSLCTGTNSSNDFIILDAYKGSKEGALVLLAPTKLNEGYIIYGFKKPVLLFELSKVKNTSYSNITRTTFNVLMTVEMDPGEEKNIEFSMIDQQYFQPLDEFIKSQNIHDGSFSESLREKETNETQAESSKGENGEQNEDDSDDEEDGNYQGEEEEGSDVDEEYDSNAEPKSDSEKEEEDGVFSKASEE